VATVRRAARIAPIWGALLPLLVIAIFFAVPVKYLPFGMRLGPALAALNQIFLIGYMGLVSAAVFLVCKYAPEPPPADTYWQARNRAVMFFVVATPAVMFAYVIPESLGGSGLLVRLAQAMGMMGSVIIVIRGYKVVSALVLVGLFLGGCMYISTGHW
jgi:hypothetical protein